MLVGLFFMVPSFTWAQNGETVAGKVSLKVVLTAVLEKNYRVQLSQQRKEISDNNTTRGNAGFLPTIGASGSYTGSNTNVLQEFSDPSRAAIKANGVSNTNIIAGVGLNWTVFDGFKMFATLDRLKELQKNGIDGVRVNMVNTLAAASVAYFNLYQQQKKLVVFQNAVSVSEDRVSLAKNKYEAGTGSKLDYLNAQVDLNTDKSSLLAQRRLMVNAKTDLNTLLVQSPETEIEALDSILTTNKYDERALREDLLSNNPQVLILMRQQNVAYQDLKILQGQLYPLVSIGTAYNLSDSRNGAGFLKRTFNAGMQYGVTASWNIYSGGNVQRNIQNQRINQDLAKLRVDSVKAEYIALLHKSFTDFLNSEEQLVLEQSNISVAQQNVSIAGDRYKLGVGTPLEYREAQRNLILAESRLIEALFVRKQAEVELLRLSGKSIVLN
jgi:outer membrane protein TolC